MSSTGTRGRRRWPITDWRTLPVNRGVEVTALAIERGMSIDYGRISIAGSVRRYGLRARKRGGTTMPARLWVYRLRSEEVQREIERARATQRHQGKEREVWRAFRSGGVNHRRRD